MSDVRAFGDPAAPRVLVLHPWWGRTAWVESFCRRLAGEGFHVHCPDVYGEGQTAATIEQAEALMEALDGDRARAIVDEAAAGLAPDGRGFAALGFSMGAQLAMGLSLRETSPTAVVAFYGGGSVPDAFASRTGARAFQGHFCEVDEWEDLEPAQALFAELARTGHDATLHTYARAGHWFMEDDRPAAYDPDAAAVAWQRSLAFLRAALVD